MAKKKGLYANIHAKRKRIKAGSGESMRKPGSKGAPKKSDFKKAAKTVINKISKMGGDGGVIAIDKQGNIAMEMNTSGMYRAHINSKGEIDVKIYK